MMQWISLGIKCIFIEKRVDMKKYFYSVATLLLMFCFQCKEVKKTEEAPKPVLEKVEESGPEFSSKYICPMHCKGSGSDHPGKCPVCEMDYELNENMLKDSIQ